MEKPVPADLLKGQRALVTNAANYMGPAICERFAEEGAVVIPEYEVAPRSVAEVEKIVAAADRIDILVVNQATAPRHSPAAGIKDEDWLDIYATLVHPTMWYVRAVLPQMLARKAGKIVAVTSAAPLYGAPEAASYSSARAAQNMFIRCVGLEVAQHNVQVNAIAQNITRNPTFWPEEHIARPEVQRMLERDVPARRFAEGWQSADLAVFLASQRSNYMSGELIPFAGGWITFSRDIDGSFFGGGSSGSRTKDTEAGGV